MSLGALAMAVRPNRLIQVCEAPDRESSSSVPTAHRMSNAGNRLLRVPKPVETLSGDPSLELPEFDAPPDEPLALLESWLQGADARGVREPRALALATADASGRPSNRIVLLKQASPGVRAA